MNAHFIASQLLEDEDDTKDLLLGAFDRAVEDLPAKEAYKLASDGKRTPITDFAVLKDPGWAFNYVRDVVEGRWPKAEPVIMQDLKWAFYYARDVIRGRWPEAGVNEL